MRPDATHDPRCARAGFSLLELMVAMVLASVVMVGVLGVLTVENRRLSQQKELGDAWLTLRSAAELMTYDLRQASPAEGDLSPPAGLAALTDSSFTVRSRRGSAVICNRTSGQATYALASVTGEFTASTGDSVKVLKLANTPTWRNVRIDAVGTPGVLGPANCSAAWSSSDVPATGIRLLVGAPIDTANVAVGSPVHAFRSTQYGIMTRNNRRWLGRKVVGSPEWPDWQILTGPLRTNGLQLEYRDANGNATNVAGQVASVRITLRGESYGRTNMRTAMSDTLTVRIQLRN